MVVLFFCIDRTAISDGDVLNVFIRTPCTNDTTTGK